MAALLINLILFIISLFILYAVIKSAINHSEMTETLKNIEQLLQKRYADTHEPSGIIFKDLKTPSSTEIRIEQCPACQCKVTNRTRVCPSCGLTLISE